MNQGEYLQESCDACVEQMRNLSTQYIDEETLASELNAFHQPAVQCLYFAGGFALRLEFRNR